MGDGRARSDSGGIVSMTELGDGITETLDKIHDGHKRTTDDLRVEIEILRNHIDLLRKYSEEKFTEYEQDDDSFSQGRAAAYCDMVTKLTLIRFGVEPEGVDEIPD